MTIISGDSSKNDLQFTMFWIPITNSRLQLKSKVKILQVTKLLSSHLNSDELFVSAIFVSAVFLRSSNFIFKVSMFPSVVESPSSLRGSN